MKQRLFRLLKELIAFLTNKRFIYHLLGIAAFVIIVIFGVLQWLKIYTHHGQQLEMPDYIDVPFDEAQKDAKSKSFELIVNDSVHIVGVPGGIIRLQNPPGGSLVKQNRKVYVTVTKYTADKIDLADLYEIYGANYDLKSAEMRGRGLNTVVMSRRYDAAENVILEVWYRGERIIGREAPPEQLLVDKGSTLEFVVSSTSQGNFIITDVRNKPVNTARFMLRKFRIGTITSVDGSPIEDVENAIVVSQDPSANTMGTVGQVVDLVVRKPD